MHAGQVAGLGYFPDGDKGRWLKSMALTSGFMISIKQHRRNNCSDESRSIGKIVP